MNYDVDELFRFEKNKDGYTIKKYLKRVDPKITELEIPAEYNGEPVTQIRGFVGSRYLKHVVIPPSVRIIVPGAFWKCKALETAELSEGLEVIGNTAFEETNLKSIVLPKSLKNIGAGAFMYCKELESVTFNSSPFIDSDIFGGCPKLPPETIAMGLVCSTDITRPFSQPDFEDVTEYSVGVPDYLRPDIFELLAKNNCFINCDLRYLFEIMIIKNKQELLPAAEQYGLLEDAKLIDWLIGYVIERKNVELTAYLLDLKKRKFGFAGFGEGDDFEL